MILQKVIKVKKTPYCLLSQSCSALILYTPMFMNLCLYYLNICLFASLLVTLVHPVDLKIVAEGTVRVREMVHGNSLADDEVAVSVSSIIGFDEKIIQI